MSQQPDSDLQAELDAMRHRLGDLEAAHRELLRSTSRSGRPGVSRKFLLGTLPVVLLVATGGLLYGQGAGDPLFIHPNGNVGIGTNTPKAQLDIQQGARTSLTKHPASIKGLYITGDLVADSGIEFRHNNGSQGIGFGYNTIYATGENANQDLNLKARGTGKVKVQGGLEGVGTVPKGAILMWSGNPAQLPRGWVLCDGTKDTPNLKGRFIVGYDPKDTDYNATKKTGGEKAHTLTVAEMPAHKHSGKTDSHRLSLRYTQGSGGTNGLAKAVNMSAANFDHQHSFTTAPRGDGKAHENRPPYFVLAYIMYAGV